MKPRSSRLTPRASTGPSPMRVQQANAVLVIDRLLPDADCRPLQVDVQTLERFSALMAGQGWTAHVSAMAFDRIYARERFIFARRKGNPELAALAMSLLYAHRYGRAGWRPPS